MAKWPKVRAPALDTFVPVYTGYWLKGMEIWGPKSPGTFYIEHNRIYGPDGATEYSLRKGCVYGAGQEGEFYIQGDRIYGPSHRVPWCYPPEQVPSP